MLRAGMARAYTRFPFSRKDAFLAAEGRARREGKGLWKDGGMTEARWLAAGNAAPVEVFPSGGRTFVLAHKGLAKAGVERGDLPKEIEGILRLRGELSDAEFASKARDRGFRPIDPSKEGPAGSGSPGQRALATGSRDPGDDHPVGGSPPPPGRRDRRRGDDRPDPPGGEDDVPQLPRELEAVPHARHLREGSPPLPRGSRERPTRGRRSASAAR